MKEMEDVEARISDLEVEIKLVRNAMIRNGNTNTTKRALNEEQGRNSKHDSDIRILFKIILRDNVEDKQ